MFFRRNLHVNAYTYICIPTHTKFIKAFGLLLNKWVYKTCHPNLIRCPWWNHWQRNIFKNVICSYCPTEKWNAKAIVKGCRETGKELLSNSMANGTAYLSHISDLPSKVFWVQGEQPQTSFLLHDVLHWLDSHQISEALQLCVCVCVCVCVWITQLCPALCDPMNCSLPGFSVHGTLQAGILEWIAIPFSRGSSQPRNRTLVSCITDRLFTVWATGKSCHTEPCFNS